jgi:hypothetical protein
MVRRDATREASMTSLGALARSPNGFVAVRALGVLAQLGERSTAGPLREALDAPDATVRRMAVLAWHDVAEWNGEVDPLAPRLTDPDASVAFLAAVEIVRITAR